MQRPDIRSTTQNAAATQSDGAYHLLHRFLLRRRALFINLDCARTT
jgi:hypothetical protein